MLNILSHSYSYHFSLLYWYGLGVQLYSHSLKDGRTLKDSTVSFFRRFSRETKPDIPPPLPVSFIAFSTVGLGDYTVKTEGGRACFCVLALVGAGVLTVFFSSKS